MKAMTLGCLLVLGGYLLYNNGAPRLPEALRAPPVTPPATAQSPPDRAADPAEACRNHCEEQAAVGQLDHQALRDCRVRCGGEAPAPERRREPIRRITRAPADHRPQAPAEWR